MEVEHKSVPGWGQVNYNTVAGSAGLLALIDRFLGGGKGWGGGGAGGDSSPAVNRYEASMQARISELETEVKLRDANIYTDGKLKDLRDYVDAKFSVVNDKLCAQAVHNSTADAMLGCLNNQVVQLFTLTKLVVPNTSICPGWGSTTSTTTTTPTTPG